MIIVVSEHRNMDLFVTGHLHTRTELHACTYNRIHKLLTLCSAANKWNTIKKFVDNNHFTLFFGRPWNNMKAREIFPHAKVVMVRGTADFEWKKCSDYIVEIEDDEKQVCNTDVTISIEEDGWFETLAQLLDVAISNKHTIDYHMFTCDNRIPKIRMASHNCYTSKQQILSQHSPFVFQYNGASGKLFTHMDVAARTQHCPHSKFPVAFIQEAPTLCQKEYANVMSDNSCFVFSYVNWIEKKKPNVWVFGGNGSWTTNIINDHFDKTSKISLIASAKRQLEGHRLRHVVVQKFKTKYNIDVMGKGYRYFKRKSDGLIPYRYSIIIENEKKPHLFTEKLTDCLMCGCVAIYWGAPNIEEYFDKGSIVSWTTMEELDDILQQCSEEDYESRKKAIYNNRLLASSRATIQCSLALDTPILSHWEESGGVISEECPNSQ